MRHARENFEAEKTDHAKALSLKACLLGSFVSATHKANPGRHCPANIFSLNDPEGAKQVFLERKPAVMCNNRKQRIQIYPVMCLNYLD